MGVHVVLERLARHGRDQLTQYEVPEVRVRRLGTGSEPHTAVAFQQTFDEPGPVRPGLVGGVDPSQRHRVGETRAVSEQMAGADRSHPLGRSQHRQGRIRVDHRRIKIQPTVLRELDHSGRRDQLGHREPVAGAPRRHLVVTDEIGGAERPLDANAVGVGSDHGESRHGITDLSTRRGVQPDHTCCGAMDRGSWHRSARLRPSPRSTLPPGRATAPPHHPWRTTPHPLPLPLDGADR